MRQIFLLLFLVTITNFLQAQETIVKKNGDEIISNVLEITTENIKYKEYDFQDGPIRNIPASDVFMIIHEDGEREIISEEETLPSGEKKPKENDGKYFMIGLGYGNSYGGNGLRVQWRTGETIGFGMHAGVGYYPDAPVLASIGLKFFTSKNLYLNAQFGATGVKYFSNPFRYHTDTYLTYGPSFLAGGDWAWGKKIGYGLNAGLGITLLRDKEIVLAIDMGFLVRL